MEAVELDKCKTIGFVIREDKHKITVASSMDGQSPKHRNVSGDMTIPRSAITKLRIVSWKK